MRSPLLLAIMLVAVVSCRSLPPKPAGGGAVAAGPAAAPTATPSAAPAIAAQGATLTTPSGRVISFTDSTEVDSYETLGPSVLADTGDRFEGTDRRAAKLSIATAALEHFASVPRTHRCP